MSDAANAAPRIMIALDLDGTLEDSRDDMVASAVRVRAGFELPARSDAQLRPFVNGGMEALYRACFDDLLVARGEQAGLAAARAAYEADYLANVAVKTRLYPGIADALHALSTVGALACVTNKPEKISRRLLDELGVGALFTTVIGGDSCIKAKPDPVMLRAAADGCGFELGVGRAFMVGDTAADMQLARAYGATGIWCGWGYLNERPAMADAEVGVPRELLDVIAGSSKRARA